MVYSSRIGMAIPPENQKKIRERCGNGCVVCGVPIYCYTYIGDETDMFDQIFGDPATTTLLCQKHYCDALYHRLSRNDLIRFDKSPFNLMRDKTNAPFDFSFIGDTVDVTIGKLSYRCGYYPTVENQVVPLTYRESSVFRVTLSQNHFLFGATLFDIDGNFILHLYKNIILECADNLEIQVLHRSFLVLNRDSGKKVLEIKVNWPNRLVIETCDFLVHGMPFVVEGEKIAFNNKEIAVKSDVMLRMSRGIVIGENTMLLSCALNILDF